VSLAAQHGKPVLMEVVASWCSACKRMSPRVVEAFRAQHEDSVTFLAVSVDEDPSAASHLKSDWNIPFAVAMDDGSVSRNYGISVLPTLIYIDGHGTVRHASAGVTSRSDLEDWLAER
jgi:thiol-disulfide isomerase/thioredoxin